MIKPIYLDYQATTPIDPDVLKTMLPFFNEKFGNASSIHHSYGMEAKEAVENSRKTLARIIGADEKEITFTSGATEAINLAIKGIIGRINQKKHIITQNTEHKAVLDTFTSIEKKGWDVTILPVDEVGLVNPESILNAITDQTVLVSIMHANNEIGTIQPVKCIGEICKKNNILFFVDACQSFGKLDINVREMNIDLLAATAHKLYGPKGIGLLYSSKKNSRVNIETQIEGGGHENGLRSGTLPVPLIVGFAKAGEISFKKQKFEYNLLGKLRNKLLDGIKNKHPDIILNGSLDTKISHNLNLCFPNLEAETMIMRMKGVACSMGSACSSATLKPSHVIKALGIDSELAHSAIRFSVGRFTTNDDISNAINEINNTVDTLKAEKQKRGKIFL